MKYIINNIAIKNIKTFYYNVAKKYKNSYSLELMHKNVDTAINSMYKIENGLLRRNPTISRWKGYFMAHSRQWYFAYKIDGDAIYIMDACHSQNMHEMIIKDKTYPILEFWKRLSRVI